MILRWLSEVQCIVQAAKVTLFREENGPQRQYTWKCKRVDFYICKKRMAAQA